NNMEVKGKSAFEVSSLLQGPNGTSVTIQQIPVWWRWYYWAFPISWTLYGLITSQLGDNNAELEIQGWVILFVFVFAYGIKFLNFQRR
ncbi:ABC transporter G family member 39, partial [Glycine soja]